MPRLWDLQRAELVAVASDEERQQALRTCTDEQLAQLGPERLIAALRLHGLKGDQWIVSVEEVLRHGEWKFRHDADGGFAVQGSVLWGGEGFGFRREVSGEFLSFSKNTREKEIELAKEHVAESICEAVRRWFRGDR